MTRLVKCSWYAVVHVYQKVVQEKTSEMATGSCMSAQGSGMHFAESNHSRSELDNEAFEEGGLV